MSSLNRNLLIKIIYQQIAKFVTKPLISCIIQETNNYRLGLDLDT